MFSADRYSYLVKTTMLFFEWTLSIVYGITATINSVQTSKPLINQPLSYTFRKTLRADCELLQHNLYCYCHTQISLKHIKILCENIS